MATLTELSNKRLLLNAAIDNYKSALLGVDEPLKVSTLALAKTEGFEYAQLVAQVKKDNPAYNDELFSNPSKMPQSIRDAISLIMTTGGASVNWWDSNAVVVIDGTLGTLGASDVVSPIPEVTLVPGTSVTHSNEQFRSGDKSLLFSNAAANYNGILTIIRDDATSPLLEELGSFTIESVTRKRDASVGANRFLFYLNQTKVSPVYTNRMVLGSNYVDPSFALRIWNNSQNPTTMVYGGILPSNLDWIHEAVTYNDTTKVWSYYVNGLLKGTHTKTLLPSTLQDEYIGSWGDQVFLDRYQIVPGVKYTEDFTPAI